MDLGITAKMVVREAMSSPIISINEDQDIVEASKIMSDQKIGSIVVVDNEEKPLGILTERDLVYRVMAEDIVPREITVKDVMSSPLKMVDPDMTLEEAIGVMARENIRRLGVIYKGRLEGIITDKDILRLMPTFIDIIRERSRIQGNSTPRGQSFVGYCARCEAYSTNLRNLDGELLCEDCRAEEE